MPIKIIPGKPTEWESTATSTIESLSTAVSSASTAGHWEVAEASNELQHVVINVFKEAKDQSQIPDQRAKEFEERISALESAGEQSGVPQTQMFKCLEDFNRCIENAKDGSGRWLCRLALGACMGERLTTFFEKS